MHCRLLPDTAGHAHGVGVQGSGRGAASAEAEWAGVHDALCGDDGRYVVLAPMESAGVCWRRLGTYSTSMAVAEWPEDAVSARGESVGLGSVRAELTWVQRGLGRM